MQDKGETLYSGPKWFRCKREECLSLVTQGMVQEHGGCWCGNRKIMAAVRLKKKERERLKTGWYPMVAWERELVNPIVAEGKEFGWGRAEWEAEYDGD